MAINQMWLGIFFASCRAPYPAFRRAFKPKKGGDATQFFQACA